MTTVVSNSYLSPKVEARACLDKGGFGLYAREPIAEGELITFWGGRVVTEAQLDDLPEYVTTHGIQVDEELYLVPVLDDDPADYFNHSCDPNAGLGSPMSLVAMRPIAVDEEICFDYAMSDSSDYDEFTCGCGTAACRGKITGHDWKLPELQKRYKGFFSPYLQRRIDRLTAK